MKTILKIALLYIFVITASIKAADFNEEEAEDYCNEDMGFIPETSDYEQCVDDNITEYNQSSLWKK